MVPVYTIAMARPQDVPLVPAIELAAARLLEGHAPESVLAETTDLAQLAEARRRGHLWVALADDVAVGFAHVEPLGPGVLHLEEIDVLPAHGRRGLGTRLMVEACVRAGDAGYEWITLTTFRDVPWNMPFYIRLGFEAIEAANLLPPLRAILDNEARRGLDPRRRVAMRRRLTR